MADTSDARLRRSSDASDVSLDEVLLPVPFRWTEGGTTVMLAGSFDSWTERYPLTMQASGSVFTATLSLKPGIYTYKFIVDGDWRCAAAQATVTDEAGHTNNCRSVSAPTALRKHPLSPQVEVDSRPSARDESRLLHNQLLLSGVSAKRPSSDNSRTVLSGRKLALVMVGLPARGKSYVAGKIARYLRWLGYSSQQFNIGSYRRTHLGDYLSHDFFRPDNAEGVAARNEMAMLAVDDMMRWLLRSGGDVAVLDGTNSTRARRQAIVTRIKETAATESPAQSVKVIFIEIICNEPDVIRANIHKKYQYSPDYVGVDKDAAIADFSARIAHYEACYEPITNKEYSFMKVFDVGRETQTNRISGYLPTKIAHFLMNLHIEPRPIFLTRHGESQYNAEDRIGGDAPLTAKGMRFADKLREFMVAQESAEGPITALGTDLVLWCSTMIRTQQTAEALPCAQLVCWKALEEIDVGICDGMTPREFETAFPLEYKARLDDKLNYRYPRGEGYHDLIKRLEPVIIELERVTMPVLVICHQAVGRCLYAYFQDLPVEEVPFTSMPLHTVIKLEQKAYITKETRFVLLDEEGHPAAAVGSLGARDPAILAGAVHHSAAITGETH